MKIIIAGLGRTGRTLVRVLKEDGHAVTVIDTDRQAVSAAERSYGVQGVVGHAAMYDTLKAAGAFRSDLFIAASGSDELNILSCFSAKHVGVGHAAAVTHSSEFLSEMPYFSTICGIDMIFNPEYETAHEIFRAARIPAAVNVLSFAGGRAELAHVGVCGGAEIIGKTLAAIRISSKLSVLVCAVKRAGCVIIPDGRFVVEQDDEIYITGPHEDIFEFLKIIGIQNNKIKNVMITGGSNTAMFLASALEKTGVGVKLIEKDAQRCRLLESVLGKTRIINADPFDGSLLTKQGLAGADSVMALSDRDEDNVILAMYAKESGAKKIVTKLSKGPLSAMLPNMGYSSAVFSEEKTLSRIALSYVRALSETLSSAVGTVCKIADGGAEIVEFIAKPGFAHAGVPLMKLNLRRGLLLAGIVRGREVLYPNGMTSILEGDRVIIVSSGESVRSLDDIVVK